MHSTHRLIAGNILPLHIVINLLSPLLEFHYLIPLHFLSSAPLTQETDTEKVEKKKT